MSDIPINVEVVLTQVVRRVEVTVLEGSGGVNEVTLVEAEGGLRQVVVHEAGGGVHHVLLTSQAGAVPWSALTSVPPGLCVATVSGDGVTVELRDLEGNLISKAAYVP